MPRFIKRSSQTIGLPPGSLVHIGEKKTGKVKITIIDYDEKHFEEKEVEKVEECFPFKEKPTVTWINVDGVHQVDIIEKVGKHFGLHPLVLEDIVNTGQRPKMEDFEDYIFIVLKMLYHSEKDDEIKAEQISLILGKNFVLSFQETEGDVFNFVRERIKNSKGRIRKVGADYLIYALLDAIVDNYFIILEKIGEKVEVMEEELVSNPIPETLQAIHNMKREMIFLRKSVWPLREVISGLQRGESKLMHKSTNIYLRDMYDHTIQVIDTVETFRDMISGMLDIYMSSVSNKMNEVMKVLTIFAAIFIPLTFVAGVYGMNFNPEASPFNMPELGWQWGYPMVWIIMIAVATTMLIYFKRKKWL
jgi:magnesium transporter